MDQNTSDQVPMPGDEQGKTSVPGQSLTIKVILFLLAIVVIGAVIIFAVRTFTGGDTGIGGVPSGPQIDF